MEFLADLLVEFICEIIDIICSIFLIPDYKFNMVTDLNEKVINELKFTHRIKGVIIDVDETIRFRGGKVSKENDQWIDTMINNFKLIVVTNGYDESIIKYFKEKGIKVFPNAFKPLKKNFIKAKSELNLDSKEILVIGDNSLTDVFGAKRVGMISCKVKSKMKKK